MRVYLALGTPTSQGTGVKDIGQLSGHTGMKLRVLISYHYYKQYELDELIPKYFQQPYPDIFLDSGAWSAFTQGVDVNVQEYIQYVRRNQHWLTVYCNLDDMLHPENTWRNQQIMEDAGLRPLPVFHTGEPWSYLERYIQNYTYIALGKIIPYTTKPQTIVPWIVQCFKKARGKSVYHGFGVTNWRLLSYFPWYSADSSSWGAGFRFGTIKIFDQKRGGWTKFNLGDERSCRRNASLIERYGFRYTDFADRSRNDRSKICAISALSYKAAEAWLRDFHGEVPMIYDDKRITPLDQKPPAEDGLKIYLADGSMDNLGRAGEGIRVYLADSVAVNFKSIQEGIHGLQTTA